MFDGRIFRDAACLRCEERDEKPTRSNPRDQEGAGNEANREIDASIAPVLSNLRLATWNQNSRNWAKTIRKTCLDPESIFCIG